LPVSPELRSELTDYYERQFGIPRAVMDSLELEMNREEIWGGTAKRLPGIQAVRSMGLRVGRAFHGGIKPTSVFLAALGPYVTRSRISVGWDDLRKLMLGQSIPCQQPEKGYVALDYEGDVLGCARLHGGRLQALIPAGRRKDLLEILRFGPDADRKRETVTQITDS
jgi:NOL1/NOP2/fmu family ribosome biogenesis protein